MQRGPVQRWNSFGEAGAALAAAGAATVVTIGNFDGVHRGHQAVLRRLVEVARARDCLAVAITFDPHPLAVLHPERAPRQILDPRQRIDLLAATGVDAVVVAEFTLDLAAQGPEEFVKGALVDALRARAVVVGEDMRFGYRNSGTVHTLRALGEQYGFDVLLLEDLGPPGPADPGSADGGSAPGARRWSSTWVRELLAAGDVAGAADVLGRDHRVGGVVVHGDHRGRDLGFPTANLGGDVGGLVPADGVYAGWLVLLDGDPVPGEQDGRRLPAAISIGTNPTFDGLDRRVEAYVLDRDDLDLYGRSVAVEFVARLRDTWRFDGVDALVTQMHADVAAARAVLAGGPGTGSGR